MSKASNVTHLPLPPSALSSVHLGPCEVVEVGPLGLSLLRSDGERVTGRLAVGRDYVPAVGDTVLAIGNGEGTWVIGVVVAQNPPSLAYQGDVSLSATGVLRLRGEEGVELEGREVSVRAGKLELMAREATQRFERLRQRVSELFSLDAGRTHTVVAGSSYTRAHEATLLTKEKVSINGKSIHLG